MTLSTAHKLALKEGIIVVLLRGYNPERERQYAYVAVRGDRVAAFKKALQKPTFVLDDYGIILASGTGDPAPETMDRMEREYGFDHAGMLTIDTGA